LLHEPEVLLLDEPTLGLDPAQIIEVRNLIQEIGRQRTVFLSTHILSEAQQVCNRVIIINNGKIIAEDTPARLQAHLTGAQRFLLQVNGDADGLEELVSAVPGVTQVATLDAGKVEFYNAPGQDVRPDVAKAVIGADYAFLEMRPIGLSLEEIFLQLTRDEPAEPELLDVEEFEEESEG
jgi:ABC-2 type transport system ATP-binding protein